MERYKHTQIGYLMLVITLAVLVFFRMASDYGQSRASLGRFRHKFCHYRYHSADISYPCIFRLAYRER